MTTLLKACILPLTVVFICSCGSTPRLAQVPEFPVEITNLGAAVNSPEDDFAPALTANGAWMYFASGRGGPGSIGGQDFWAASRENGFWGAPVNLGTPVNTPANEGTCSISADGQELVFAACARGQGNPSCDIFTARLAGRTWEDIRRLPPPVSTDAWESQPCISADGRELYFVSDRPGGIGGLDIWIATRDERGGWSRVRNAGRPVNTERDELAPQIAGDGRTLYFASDGHPGLGGTDLFVSRFDGAVWSEPMNFGTPINSAGNDEFVALAAEGATLYFASRRAGGHGGLDLYQAAPNPFPPGAVMVLAGTVRDKVSRRPMAAVVTAIDSTTGDVILTQSSNAYSGEYLVVLPKGRRCIVAFTAPGRNPMRLTFDLRDLRAYREERRDVVLGAVEPAPALSASVTTDVLVSDLSLISGGRTLPGLTIEEIVSRETIPLLPYIFFDSASAAIPARYVRAGRAGAFSLRRLPDGTIEKYHHVLDIVGLRMRESPGATLTLTGIADESAGAADRQIARRRADSVRMYLVDAWNLDPARITATARSGADRLPVNAPGELRDELRRVEMQSSDPAILAAVTRVDTVRTLKPARAVFYPGVTADAGVRSWSLDVRQAGATLWRREGAPPVPDSLTWDWTDEHGGQPAAVAPMVFALEAVDNRGTRVRSAPDSIPVRAITLELKALQQLPDRTIEKLSLILFDYDKATITPRHEAALRETMARITPGSTLLIRGYTDALGADEYNMRLAGRRAEAVRAFMARSIPDALMRTEAVGESVILYPGLLPESRFYCRTVQVLVETLTRR